MRRRPPAILVLGLIACWLFVLLGAGGFGLKPWLILLTSWTSFGVLLACLAPLVLLMLFGRVLLVFGPDGLTVPALTGRQPIPWAAIAAAGEGGSGAAVILRLPWTLPRPLGMDRPPVSWPWPAGPTAASAGLPAWRAGRGSSGSTS